ncbi:unnamed protein product [Candidula unifasciata]|uniref:PiggyBac transposable element-derived protein domain-containing protein n=1 Tax=Candidula unifasciata TaxID=100452 RepID=A0A8S3YRM8_9EUPU|nr:unnamed protein product [Candidula unifasciata]
MANSNPSTSTANRAKRMTKMQALDLMQRLLDEEDNSSSDDNLDSELSDNDVDDDDREYQPSAAKHARLNGKGKGKQNNNKAYRTAHTAAVVDESEPDSDNNSVDFINNDNACAVSVADVMACDEAEENVSIGSSLFRSAGSGIRASLDENSTPLDCLLTLLTTDIIDSLVENINLYSVEKIQKNIPLRKRSTLSEWQPMTREICFQFLSVVIAMGITPKHDIKDYWSTANHKFTPWFKVMFPRTKFLLVYQSMLHASEPKAQGQAKIEPSVNNLVAKFQSAFCPYGKLFVDEMVIGFKGRFHAKQYNAAKPHKYHKKTFGLCDSVTGYVYNLLIYFGAKTAYNPELDPTSTHAVKVFSTLLQGVESYHHLFANRFYTSLPLIKFFLSMKLNYTGMVNKNRKGLPQQLKQQPAIFGTPRWLVNNEQNILCVSWRDKKSKKKPCILLTTNESSTFEERQEGSRKVQKPSPIYSYNMSMNGCDRLDQMVSYYSNHNCKTKKWWKKVFTWIVEVTQVNAHILYMLSHRAAPKRMSLAHFKDKLIQQLTALSGHEVPTDMLIAVARRPGKRPTLSDSFVGADHLVDYAGADRQCVQCSKKKI